MAPKILPGLISIFTCWYPAPCLALSLSLPGAQQTLLCLSAFAHVISDIRSLSFGKLLLMPESPTQISSVILSVTYVAIQPTFQLLVNSSDSGPRTRVSLKRGATNVAGGIYGVCTNLLSNKVGKGKKLHSGGWFLAHF